MKWKTELAKGATWALITSNTLRVLSLISTVVLARLLSPGDFGIVAMATAVTVFVTMLGDFGFHIYVVQKKDLSRKDLDAAWTAQVGLAVAEALILFAIARPVAEFYGEFRLVPVFWVLSGTILIEGFKNIGTIYFQRDLRFHLDFALRTPSKALGFLVTLIFAFLVKNYWALVLGISIQKVAIVLLSYFLSSYRPRFQVKGFRDLFRFSKWIYCNTTLSFLCQRCADLLLGKLAGNRAVGLFSISNSIATLPTSELADPIARATFPAFAKVREELRSFQEGYIRVLGMLALVVIPLGVGIAATAGVLVPVVLGEKWLPTVPLLKVLSIAAVLKTLQSNTGSVFLAEGKPWVVTFILGCKTAALLSFLFFFTRYKGFYGAALAYLLTEMIITPFSLGITLRALGMRLKDLMHAIWRPTIAAIVMYTTVSLYLLPFTERILTGQAIIRLTLVVLAGGVVFVGCVFTLWIVEGKDMQAAEATFLGWVHQTFFKLFLPARN